MDFGVREFVAQRFHYSRAHADMRNPELGWRRVVYFCGSPLLIPLLLACRAQRLSQAPASVGVRARVAAASALRRRDRSRRGGRLCARRRPQPSQGEVEMRVGIDAYRVGEPPRPRHLRATLSPALSSWMRTQRTSFMSTSDPPGGSSSRHGPNGGLSLSRRAVHRRGQRLPRSVADLARMTLAVLPPAGRLPLPFAVYVLPRGGRTTVVWVRHTIAEDFPNLTRPTRRARLYWSAKRRLALGRAARLFTVWEASGGSGRPLWPLGRPDRGGARGA